MSRKKPSQPTRAETRARHAAVVLAYAEEAGEVGGDVAKDRAAQLRALERGGYTRAVSETARLRKFRAIWGSDASRMLLMETWGFAVPEAADPLAVMQKTLYEHMTQPVTTCEGCGGSGLKEVEIRGDETFVGCPACEGTGKRSSWGARDRAASLAAVAQATKMFVPTQTHKVDQRRVVVNVERPAEFEGGGAMSARNILPAGQTLAGPQTSEPEDDGDEGDDDQE